MACSCSCPSGLGGLHHGDEQFSDAGGARVAQGGELLAIGIVEEQDAAAEDRSLVDRLERSCRGEVLWVYHHFHVARLECFHAGLEDDAAAVQENEVGED